VKAGFTAIVEKDRIDMRLRTGRLSLFYDAQEDNTAVDNGMPLKRWPGEEMEQLAPVSGTLLTVVLPIETTR